MLIEARGRAGPHLRAIVRQAERTSPGAFLTRMRGEAVDVHARRGEQGVRIGLGSGRCLDVDTAVLVTGSLAAAAIVDRADAGAPRGIHRLPSEGTPGALAEPVNALADALLSAVQAAQAPAA